MLKVMNDDEFDVITYSLIGPHARLYVPYTRPASIYLSLCLSLSMSVSARNVPGRDMGYFRISFALSWKRKTTNRFRPWCLA